MTEEEKVKKAWHDEWTQNATIEDSASIIGKWLRRQRLEITKKLLKHVITIEGNRDFSVIDMGCGGGTTLKTIRSMGLKNSIGIDFEPCALQHCEEQGYVIGKDVYQADAKKTSYHDKQFHLVFEEGLWEHFQDPAPFVVEAARIADKWILAIQPDHYTFFGALLHLGWNMFKGGGVKEYSFKMSYFIDILEKKGFKLVKRKSTMLQEQAVLLFKRVDR